MKFIKKLFSCNTEQSKYRIPIVKMLGAALVYAVFFLMKNPTADDAFLIKLVFECFRVAVFASIWVFIMGLCELVLAWDNNHPDSYSALKPVKYQQQAIVKMSCDNDIIEFKVWLNEKAVKLGSSSDYDRKTDKFFDKLYYIGKAEYKTAIEFADAMHELNGNRGFDVISIDGVPASKY